MSNRETKFEGLPVEISEALQGLQAQAGLVTASLPSAPKRESLADAHRMMAANRRGVRQVLEFVKETDTPVPEVKPEALREWLKDKDSLWLSHEKPIPVIYAACVDECSDPGSGVYFLTAYWGDVDGCAGHSFSREDALKLMHEALEPGAITLVEEDSEVRRALLSKLRRPDLVSHVATATISH
jgi:predicted RNase H-like HicB family nuclease